MADENKGEISLKYNEENVGRGNTDDLISQHRKLNGKTTDCVAKRERCIVKAEINTRARRGDTAACAYALQRKWVTKNELAWKPEVLDGDGVSPTIEMPLREPQTAAA